MKVLFPDPVVPMTAKMIGSLLLTFDRSSAAAWSGTLASAILRNGCNFQVNLSTKSCGRLGENKRFFNEASSPETGSAASLSVAWRENCKAPVVRLRTRIVLHCVQNDGYHLADTTRRPQT